MSSTCLICIEQVIESVYMQLANLLDPRRIKPQIQVGMFLVRVAANVLGILFNDIQVIKILTTM